MKLRKLIPFAIIFALSIFLRSINLLDRAPFDWDQNRDYSQVLAISQGEYLPLGPVAKGSVGGFFLPSLLPLPDKFQERPLQATATRIYSKGLRQLAQIRIFARHSHHSVNTAEGSSE